MGLYEERMKDRPIPDSLLGTYARWMGGPPDEEGVTYLPSQRVADIVSGNEWQGYGGTAWAPDAWASNTFYEPDQRAFINQDRAESWGNATGLPPWLIDQYLRGHELYHSDSLMGGAPVGNKGEQASPFNVPGRAYGGRTAPPGSKHSMGINKMNIENTPASIETWLKGYHQESRPPYENSIFDVERGASQAGGDRVKQFIELMKAKSFIDS